MYDKKVAINDVLAKPELLNHDECYSFFDWFCKESSLKRRAEEMLPKLKFLVKEGIIDGDKCYVWFKNNCPCNGTLYDDMRISTLEDKDFLGGFCPKTGHYNADKVCSVWTVAEGKAIEYEFDTWSDFKKEVKNNNSFKKILQNNFRGRC